MKKKGKTKAKAKSTRKTTRTKRSSAPKKTPARKTSKRPSRKAPKAKKAKAKAKAKKASPQKASPSKVIAPPNSVLLGIVEDYFAHVGVIAFTLQGVVSVGDRIQVLGHTTHIEQTVDSMQINHQPVQQAGPRDGVGIKVTQRARAGDHIYLLQ